MWYTLSIALVVAAIVILVALVLATVRGLRRFLSAASMVRTGTNDRLGLLKARGAAVRVAVRQRRPVPENQ
ncbi:bacteriophage holin [Amycolatopsis cynarae]|uniref:Bacteriophage holin n=1 Tax=Amycolatopsis cynarae TaxID=2995223 RepID=A0ABY7ATL9_9PSEU|nr:bacteriophage holin [Amycolatopsis sp. HUAS 11-8]WAL63311.1 bacteriophage holin [Amycolatopsis sp. HUAS 11-8]